VSFYGDTVPLMWQ